MPKLETWRVRDTTPPNGRKRRARNPQYAAPEQMTNAANVSCKADVDALGLIAYEIAKRESPWGLIFAECLAFSPAGT